MPHTKPEMERLENENGLWVRGYKYQKRGECHACGAKIEWWVSPRDYMVPVDDDTCCPHWATCPQSAFSFAKGPYGI
jgi:hypothetical protein